MTTLQRVKRFLQKPPEQIYATAHFFATMWFSKLRYTPHRVHLRLNPEEQRAFWWSYFPASYHPHRSPSEYWGDDVGDIRFLWKYLKPGMTFLDIGAYHGISTIIAAKRLAGTGHVVAFEPSPRERNRVQLHLRYNRIASATLEPYALAGEESKVQLSLVVEGYTTMNSLRPPAIDHPIKCDILSDGKLVHHLPRNEYMEGRNYRQSLVRNGSSF